VTGLAIAWISALALIGPLLVEHELDASRDDAKGGDIVNAVEHAQRARTIEPWAASPYVQLGLLAELQGDLDNAKAHFSDAIEREDHNWQWYYLRSEVEHQAGEEPAAREDLQRARELNPEAECLKGEWTC
jgi:tetratricopeptide (TPR) repeat protein